MPLGAKFVPEGVGAIAPMGIGEGEKLACHKIAGMPRHNVEKASFSFRVAEGLESREMGRCDVHSVRISVMGVTGGNSLTY
jgi:hypothetical protein